MKIFSVYHNIFRDTVLEKLQVAVQHGDISFVEVTSYLNDFWM